MKSYEVIMKSYEVITTGLMNSKIYITKNNLIDILILFVFVSEHTFT